jgi:putative oxygen-independent coproporphyrinogen III oxidase
MIARGVEGPTVAAREAARAGLYVHVPFCSARCAYCDFSSGSFSVAAAGRWLAALEREVAQRAPGAAGLVFSSVFVGGGTPSTLAPGQVGRLFGALRGGFAVAPDAEITLEANPESVDARRLVAWREAGVNRLSIGVQSFHADELERLGRIHPAARPAEAFALARAQGFGRLSLDLMFGFPGHTPERWRTTLERALELEPEHLSAYALSPESGTRLGDAVLAGAAPVPSDEEQAEAYGLFVERAARAGLGSYETSNVCRPGAEARHNLVYWLRRPYVGLGPSAHGLVDGARYGNHRDFEPWAAALESGGSPEAEREAESPAAAAREVLLLGLRLTTGASRGDYEAELWEVVARRYGAAIDEAVASGRLHATADGYAIPRALRYLADDVLAWIEARAQAHGFDSGSAHSVPSSPCPSPPSSATGATPTPP